MQEEAHRPHQVEVVCAVVRTVFAEFCTTPVATVQRQGDTMPSMITTRAVYAVGSHSPSSIFLYYFVPRGKFIMQINANNSAAICTRAASINSLCVLPIPMKHLNSAQTDSKRDITLVA